MTPFGDQPEGVAVMAGDCGTADIGFPQVLHSWFRKERFTTIMLGPEAGGGDRNDMKGRRLR